MVIKRSIYIKQVLEILKEIQKDNPSVKADDIAIIILDDNKQIYDYIDRLCYNISDVLKWNVNRAYESKTQEDNAVYITNPNNVKGLEFPFVICITGSIKNTYKYRNILYTMLTRSFIQSYLLVQNHDNLEVQEKGLNMINQEKYIASIEPTNKEKEDIKQTLVKLQENTNLSYKDFLNGIFDELKIKFAVRKKIEKALLETDIEKFDKEQTINFINANKGFYSK
jgi:superfamily I DNA and RNA helicase